MTALPAQIEVIREPERASAVLNPLRLRLLEFQSGRTCQRTDQQVVNEKLALVCNIDGLIHVERLAPLSHP